MALELELETYHANLPDWSEHEGKYALIHREDVIGFYTSYEDALKTGYERFKLEPFLVKQVSTVEQIQFISRLVDPCTALQ
jgi:hypothetical protein